MALQLVITNAGRAAVIDQANGGFRAVRIAAVGVSPTAVTAAATATTLPGEVKRIASIAGEATATDVVHLTVTDESDATYSVRSFALYLTDGTLFALYGQADAIVEKSGQALLLLAIDVTLAAIPAAAITFGNANFTNPAATTDRAGVVELATDDEAEAVADARRAVSPSNLRRFARLSGATFTGVVTTRKLAMLPDVEASLDLGRYSPAIPLSVINVAPLGGLVQIAGNVAMRILPGRIDAPGDLACGGALTRGGNKVWDAANDGAGSGLDADLLDGRQGAEFALLSGATFTGPVATQTLSVQPDVNATLDLGRFSPANPVSIVNVAAQGGLVQIAGNVAMRILPGRVEAPGDLTCAGALTRAGNRVWDAANDGAGSGLDADLLDGWHRDDVRDWNNLINKPASFPVAAHTHAAADIAAAFPGALASNGYTILPNGLILQWVTGAQQSPTTENAQTVAFPISFNECFQVFVSTQVAAASISSHVVYQLISFSTGGATVMRQLVDAASSDSQPSWPHIFAIGR